MDEMMSAVAVLAISLIQALSGHSFSSFRMHSKDETNESKPTL